MAQYLNDNPAASVTIEGHCDDLGSAEYNLALGDKRARQAREYLTKLGIDGKRVQVLSFGEEKPAIENPSDDAAREKNRRDEFALDKKNNG
jgi:peptidoglycan-associated lipoprotein